jgi:hypothetical protein
MKNIRSLRLPSLTSGLRPISRPPEAASPIELVVSIRGWHPGLSLSSDLCNDYAPEGGNHRQTLEKRDKRMRQLRAGADLFWLRGLDIEF